MASKIDYVEVASGRGCTVVGYIEVVYLEEEFVEGVKEHRTEVALVGQAFGVVTEEFVVGVFVGGKVSGFGWV